MKRNLKTKLALNKKTIVNLNEEAMKKVMGGDPFTYSCPVLCSKSRIVDSCCICYTD